MKLILCMITVSLTASVVLGQPAAPKKTDASFVIKAGETGAGELGSEVKAGRNITFTLKIDRVVGKTDGQGNLESPTTLIANGVVPEFVTLKLTAYDVDSGNEEVPNCRPREFDEIFINGQKIGKNGESVYLSGKDRAWRTNTFEVPTSIIRFGKFQNDQWQGAGENDFEIRVSTRAPSKYSCSPTPDERYDIEWSAKVQWAAISFKAMYPVVMIHGGRSGPEFFTNHSFISPFIQDGIPFDSGLQMDQRGTLPIADNGNKLSQEIPRIAKEKFHVKHLHIIAHSRGGLDSRD